MNIRPGTVEDADGIAKLIDSFRESLLDHPVGKDADPYLESVLSEAEARYLSSSRYSYFIAEESGIFLGFIAMRDISHIFHLFVCREQQRRGIARCLWEVAKQRAFLNEGAHQFTVNSSLPAVEVYQAFGFEASSSVVSVHGISFLPMRSLLA